MALALTPKLRRFLRPRRREGTYAWAQRAAFIPPEISAEHGKLDLGRTPYSRGIADALDDPKLNRVAFMSGVQVGKTMLMLCWLGRTIENDPSPTLFVYPNAVDAKQFSKEKLQPFFEACPTVRARKDEAEERYTLLSMHFEGMWLNLVSANSRVALAQRAVRFIALDEIDKYKHLLGDESGPIQLVEKRLTTFERSKIFVTSTPTTQHGPITTIFKDCDWQHVYHVPCPHCGKFQELIFSRDTFKFLTDELSGTRVVDVHYVCVHCHGEIYEHHKREMLAAGKWVVEVKKRERPTSKGFRLSGLYSPFPRMTWAKVAEAFLSGLEALKHGDPAPMRDWKNSYMGEAWEEKEVSLEAQIILAKADDARTRGWRRASVPAGGRILTMGVDVHKESFVAVVRAWGSQMVSWLVLEQIISPRNDEALLSILGATFRREDGRELLISRGFIDSRYETEWVDALCRRARWRLVPTFGQESDSRHTRPWATKINSRMELVDGNLRMNIPSAHMKDGLFALIERSSGGPGSWNVHQSIGAEYAEQMTAQERVLEYNSVTGRHKVVWKQRMGRPDHYLDAENLAYACALSYNVDMLVEQQEAPKQEPIYQEQDRGKPPGNWVTGGGGSKGNWVTGG